MQVSEWKNGESETQISKAMTMKKRGNILMKNDSSGRERERKNTLNVFPAQQWGELSVAWKVARSI